MKRKYDFGNSWDEDNKWTNLGNKRKCVTHDVSTTQYQPKEVLEKLCVLANYCIYRLGGYTLTYLWIGSKILIRVSDMNEPEETLQTPVRIWLSYKKSRVCDEFRLTMEISFGWYSMVKEYVPVEQSGYWVETHDNGAKYTPPYSRCHTIFNRIISV